jgi:hypothetical protein
MESNEFNEGIAPGGLTDSNDIKILICYLLKSIGRPLTFDNFNEILQHDGLCNYFVFASALHELLVSGHIDLFKKDGIEYYKTTSLGDETASLFERRLPAAVREKAVNAAINLFARIKRESENRVEITENPSGGFNVKCSVLDMDDSLMTVNILVYDKSQAQAVKRQFQSNPETIYKGVLGLLTGDFSTVAEIAKDNMRSDKKQ